MYPASAVRSAASGARASSALKKASRASQAELGRMTQQVSWTGRRFFHVLDLDLMNHRPEARDGVAQDTRIMNADFLQMRRGGLELFDTSSFPGWVRKTLRMTSTG